MYYRLTYACFLLVLMGCQFDPSGVSPTHSSPPPDLFCPEGDDVCGETCVELLHDIHNCGECGNTCSWGETCDFANCVAFDPCEKCEDRVCVIVEEQVQCLRTNEAGFSRAFPSKRSRFYRKKSGRSRYHRKHRR